MNSDRVSDDVLSLIVLSGGYHSGHNPRVLLALAEELVERRKAERDATQKDAGAT